jgi:hypothetical protein
MNWIDSFLSNKQQCVVVNGYNSEKSAIVSGVPQGTVLGPILFLAHINNIADNVTSEIRLFADECRTESHRTKSHNLKYCKKWDKKSQFSLFVHFQLKKCLIKKKINLNIKYYA